MFDPERGKNLEPSRSDGRNSDHSKPAAFADEMIEGSGFEEELPGTGLNGESCNDTRPGTIKARPPSGDHRPDCSRPRTRDRTRQKPWQAGPLELPFNPAQGEALPWRQRNPLDDRSFQPRL